MDILLDELENLLDQTEENDYDYTEELQEQMENLVYNQHDINDLPYEYAIKTLRMTPYQFYQLQLYIEQYGPLVTLYEIAAIPGFSEEDMERLRHLLTVSGQEDTKFQWRDLLRKSRHTLWFRYGRVLERQAGYDTTRSTHYAGTPGHVCFRYTWNMGGDVGGGHLFCDVGVPLSPAAAALRDLCALVGDHLVRPFGDGPRAAGGQGHPDGAVVHGTYPRADPGYARAGCGPHHN